MVSLFMIVVALLEFATVLIIKHRSQSFKHIDCKNKKIELTGREILKWKTIQEKTVSQIAKKMLGLEVMIFLHQKKFHL